MTKAPINLFYKVYDYWEGIFYIQPKGYARFKSATKHVPEALLGTLNSFTADIMSVVEESVLACPTVGFSVQESITRDTISLQHQIPSLT
jgi:hypothetical protein